MFWYRVSQGTFILLALMWVGIIINAILNIEELEPWLYVKCGLVTLFAGGWAARTIVEFKEEQRYQSQLAKDLKDLKE